MPPDFGAFRLSDMVECAGTLRAAGTGASSMEEVGHRIVRYLYRAFAGGGTGTRSCVLVRFYKTHPFGGLDPDLQDFARSVLRDEDPWPQMKCLTLLASAGDEPEWNDRRRSRGHKALPLPSPHVVRSFPMIARLVSQLGVELGSLLAPASSLLIDLEQRNYNVFHVPSAPGSPFVPAQDDFVVPYGVESVLGFGGLLPSMDLFAVILFSRDPITEQTAHMFTTAALSVKLALLPFEGKVFASAPDAAWAPAPSPAPDTSELLGSQIHALGQLLDVHERTVLDQARAIEEAMRSRAAALVILEEERTRLREVLAQIPAAIGMYEGPDHTLTFANESFMEVAGRRPDCIGKPLRQLFPELESQGYFELFDSVRSTGRPFFGREARVLIDRGHGGLEEAFVDYGLLPLRDARGDVEAVISHSYDVTEQVLARREAEDLAAALRGLAEVSISLSSASSLDEILSETAHEARSLLGARHSVVTLAPSPKGERGLESAFDLSERQSGLRPHFLKQDVYGLLPLIARSRSVIRLTSKEIEERSTRRAGPNPDTDRPPADGWLAAPMLDRTGAPLGFIEVAGKIVDDFGERDESVLLQLARLAGAAVENMRLYEREHRIAETLQRSLLPDALPQVPGIQVAGRYRAGARGVEVGGDWYDAIELPQGRIGLVLGDVVGKGVRAAAAMGQIRTAVRLYALEEDSPATVIERVDRAMQRLDPQRMATLLYVVVDPAASAIRMSTAGHPPPLLAGPGGDVSFLEDGRSVPLGVDPDIERVDARAELAGGSTLLLYSDGLVERRGESIEVGMAALADAVRDADGDLRALCDGVLRRLLPERGGGDDVAILALRTQGGDDSGLTIDVRSDPTELGPVRRELRHWLRGAGATDREIFEISVACTEACANAIEHGNEFGADAVRVEARLTDGGAVRITVRDRGSWKEPGGSSRGRGLPLIGALMDDFDIDRAPGGTRVVMRRRLTATAVA